MIGNNDWIISTFTFFGSWIEYLLIFSFPVPFTSFTPLIFCSVPLSHTPKTIHLFICVNHVFRSIDRSTIRSSIFKLARSRYVFVYIYIYTYINTQSVACFGHPIKCQDSFTYKKIRLAQYIYKIHRRHDPITIADREAPIVYVCWAFQHRFWFTQRLSTYTPHAHWSPRSNNITYNINGDGSCIIHLQQI